MEKKKADNLIKQQIFLENEADIDYMVFHLGTTKVDFWKHFSWNVVVNNTHSAIGYGKLMEKKLNGEANNAK